MRYSVNPMLEQLAISLFVIKCVCCGTDKWRNANGQPMASRKVMQEMRQRDAVARRYLR